MINDKGKPSKTTLGWHWGTLNNLTYFSKLGGGVASRSNIRIYSEKGLATFFLKKIMMSLLLLVLGSQLVFGFERRKPQFATEPSYLILPLPYSLPGIGEGIMATGLAGNFMETYTDIYGVSLSGDAQGWVAGIEDVHLWPETFVIGLYQQSLNKAAVSLYKYRGMDTKKDDFNYMILNKVYSNTAVASLYFGDRQIELRGISQVFGVGISEIKNPEEETIATYDEPWEFENKTFTYSLLIDYTDDYQDPHKGLRVSGSRTNNMGKVDENDPEYYVIDKGATVYIPFVEQSTFALRYVTSDAIVTREGLTDKTILRQTSAPPCPPNDIVCEKAANETVDNIYAGNKYGTSRDLGGEQMLRAYPMMRFQGAHTRYMAAELRWNFLDKVVPFNFWIWKDVSTGIQLALFYEEGRVAETEAELADHLRTSTGAGVRMISASGYVYRMDIAQGDEGRATTVMFNYPW